MAEKHQDPWHPGDTVADAESAAPVTEPAGSRPDASLLVMPHRRSQRVLQTDVAAAAGVSYQTVSRVLNGHPSVRTETRERVRDAIRRLGYNPDRNARALATGRTRTLGVIIFDATLFGPASTLDAISLAARRSGYQVFTVVIKTSSAADIREVVDDMIGHAVQGLITIAPSKTIGKIITDCAPELPMISLDGSFDDRVTVVTVDEAAGAAMATDHLLGLGHRTVWHVAGREDSIAAEGRIDGWRTALQAAGAPMPPPCPGGWDAAAGYAAGELLAGRSDVTAVFAANDQMAIGVIRALVDAGRRIPADVSVMGFDDIPESAYLTPRLTTIRADFLEMGRRCVDLIMAQIDGTAGNGGRSVVPPSLVARESTGPYPG